MKIQKKTMKKPLALLLGVTLILMLAGVANATEYNPAYPWYLSVAIPSALPRDSSIACAPDFSHCMAMVYDDLYKTLNGFLIPNPRAYWGIYTPSDFTFSFNYSYYDTYQPFFHYPFGIQYNKNDGNYYYWYGDPKKTVGGHHGIEFYRYNTLYKNSTYLTNLPTPSVSCPIVFGQGTANTGNVYYDGYGSIYKYNMFTGTNNNTGISTGLGFGFSCTSVDYEKGYVGEKSGGTPFQIYFVMQYQYLGTKNTTFSYNMSGFPSPFSGIHYELNNDIYYAINTTVNYTSGIYKVRSTDFSSYSGNMLYYTFNPAIEEYIPRSIGGKTDIGVMYQQYRECNSTYGGQYCPQISNSNVTFNLLTFQSQVLNPVTNVNSPVSTLIQATCNSINFTTSGNTPVGGGILTLGVPCDSNITLIYTNTLLRPAMYSEIFNLPSGCSSLYTRLTYSQPYTLTSIVTDGLINTPLQGATVTLDTTTNTTNANGQAFISNVFPYDSPTFISSFTNSSCQHGLTTSGNPHSFFYTVSKNDYSTVTISPLSLVNATSSFATGVLRTVIYPNGINVQITTHTSDGFTVTPVSTTTNWSGAFIQSNLVQGAYNPNQTTAGGIPVNFILFSNLSTYNLTVNLTYNNITQTKIVTITNGTNDNCDGGYCIIDFTLPYTFITFPCFKNSDCVGGTCFGNTFYDLIGCRAGTCSYTQTICPSCDSRVGCYNTGTTQPCNGDQDCNKTCTSTSTASYGYCSSTGNCIYKDIICDLNIQCINTTIPINGTSQNYSAGICANHQVCFSQTTSQLLFQIIKNYQVIGFIFNPSSVESLSHIYLDNRVSCTPTEASATARHCIQGVNVPIIESGSVPESNHIVTQVGGTSNTWQFKASPYNTSYYQFYDLSYQCNLNCEVDIQFCQYGCNSETGFCYQSAQEGGGIGISGCNQSIFLPICSVGGAIVNTTTNITLTQSLQAGGFGFILLFLTPIFWIMMLIVAIMIGAAWITSHMEIGIASGVAMLIAMAVIFPELVWITIVMIVIAGFIVGRMVVKVVQGG
jgi:hypothetical protein